MKTLNIDSAFFKLSPEERKALGQEASDYVRTEFTWDKTAREYLAMFEEGLT